MGDTMRAIFAANLQAAINEVGMGVVELERRSGVTRRMVRFLLNEERTASIEIADELGAAFGLDGADLSRRDFPGVAAIMAERKVLGILSALPDDRKAVAIATLEAMLPTGEAEKAVRPPVARGPRGTTGRKRRGGQG